MINNKKLDEADYSVDFSISEKYIAFSSELLRIALLIIGGLGTLIIKGGISKIFDKPLFIIISLVLFVISSSAALCHRYYATDTLSWYVSLLRAENNNDQVRAEKERTGFYKLMKLSRCSLITCEIAFALGVISFLIALLNLFCFV